jgi:ribosomal protein L11 methyltransferase
MMNQMQYLDFKGKKVLDFGTGTGVLAILAEKLGAVSVLAIDNDDWSIDNANENIRVNHCQAIQVRKADDLIDCSGFDIILANINKHILLENATQLRNLVQSGGFLLLSGLLTQDRAEIEKVFGEPPLKLLANYVKNGWIVLIFLHNV